MQAGAATPVALGRRIASCFAGRRNGSAWLGRKVHVAVLAVCMCPGARAYVLMHMADVCVCVLCAWAWPAAQPIAMQTGVRAIAAFAPQSAGSGPDIDDCLDI